MIHYLLRLALINYKDMDESKQSLFSFMREQSGKIFDQLLAHIGLTFISLLIAVIIGVPLGIFIAKRKKLSGSCVGFCWCFANHSQHCITWIYDSVFRHWPNARNCGFIFICIIADCQKYLYRNYWR